MKLAELLRSVRSRIKSSPRRKPGGVLVASYGDDPELLRNAIDDTRVISGFTKEVDSVNARTAEELVEAIEATSPEIMHLLANFNQDASLKGGLGLPMKLNDLMKLSHEHGVTLFIVAAENDFRHLQNDIYSSREMSFLTITHRNRHYPAFLTAFIERLGKDPNIAMAYVALAPQHPSAQVGRPLPGSIAICPAKKGKDLVLWSEPQP